MTISDTEKNKRLEEIFTEIIHDCSLSGIVFAGRKGEIIAQKFNDAIDFELIVSMTASMFETAIKMRDLMNLERMEKIITELEDYTIMVQECDENSFLIFILNSGSNLVPFFNNSANYVRKLSFLY